MPVDFFSDPLSCNRSISHTQFGLCDPGGNLPAYADANTPASWIATVQNKNALTILIVPGDHCLPLVRSNGQMAQCCDVIMRTPGMIFFVELKDRRDPRSARRRGTEQLWETLLIFKENHDLFAYARREAYVSNKRRPHATVPSPVKLQQFRDEGVKLLYQATIPV